MNNQVIEFQDEKLDFRVAEAINMLRGNIQMAGFNCKAVAVTSASPNEGKSFVAFQLAKSMAALGKKTVLVDCDIRNSAIKRRYRINQKSVGLSEYLCGLCSADEAIFPTVMNDFHIVFAGKKAPNPSELLSSELLGKLIGNLKEKFDYVILDTPPVNIVVDAMIVAAKADTTILVVKSCFTEKETAVHMENYLKNNGVKILGVVMNLCGAKQSRYGKYGYGKYGYGKYGYDKYGQSKYGYGENDGLDNSDSAKDKEKVGSKL